MTSLHHNEVFFIGSLLILRILIAIFSTLNIIREIFQLIREVLIIVLILVFGFAVSFNMLCNNQIGLAVGDIAEMEKQASRRRLVDLVYFFTGIEKSLPKYLRRSCKLIKFACTEKGDIEVNKLDANEVRQQKYYEDIKEQIGKIERILLQQQLRLESLESELHSVKASESP
ncbi:uncharacterized protein TRIADDRAFT_53534 [Trichoplax adhaerens]|uniref:Uncharacterized protein n=1 Tax=Trichoplax adhaerens TaxID=10228 RepID=B3RPG8_TRIAD|nr:hypothetical protein TRIADDRAFT_53534 [Trichoplax adhaerens]EDV27634.1 hypothetical protein TRIADDRAFT_53534 [Trichoplax adhaerens]|eukprot:XP_002109468.1 hypothetical protein TRIADDRAFT_53534 [Trichoplax adhaerens]